MPGALSELFLPATPVAPLTMALRLVIAAALGAAVAWVYGRTRPSSDTMTSFPGTLVLLAILIAMVTQVIGDSVARAFSLVGALSIVRFRTVVRDTQDTAFVIFAVVVGMAAGASHVWVALVGFVIVGAAAFLMRDRTSAAVASAPAFVIRLRMALGQDLNGLLGGTLDAFLVDRRLRSMSTAKSGLALDVIYDIRLKLDRSPDDLVRTLNRIDGVQDVELRRHDLEEAP